MSKTHILEVRAKNVKCVREVEISDIGDILEIRGDSGQGKTTILDAIEGGLKGMDPSMITKGASAAEITLHLTNALINRIVHADGSKDTLTVTDAGGKPISKAAAFLKALCGPQVFRPIEWVRLGGGDAKGKTERLRAQRDMLLSAVPLTLTPEEATAAVMDLGDDVAGALREVNLDGVDWDGHALVVCEALHRATYDHRKLQNSRADDAANALRAMPLPERKKPSEAIAECRKAEDQATRAYHEAAGQAQTNEALTARRDQLAERIRREADELPGLATIDKAIERERAAFDAGRAEIDRLRAELRNAEDAQAARSRRLDDLRSQKAKIEAHEARKAELAELNASFAQVCATPEDVERLRLAMVEAQETRKAREVFDSYDSAAERSRIAAEHAARFSKLVDLFRDVLPKALAARMTMPVAGLGVDGDAITIHGVPLHQLGTSEQIRVGVQIAAALNPHTGFILVDGAESMGRDDRRALADAAAKLGLQLIMTIVDQDAAPAEGRVVMRGGEAVCPTN